MLRKIRKYNAVIEIISGYRLKRVALTSPRPVNKGALGALSNANAGTCLERLSIIS
jgi:hypothetical protein